MWNVSWQVDGQSSGECGGVNDHVSETKIDDVTGHSAEIRVIIMFEKLLEV